MTKAAPQFPVRGVPGGWRDAWSAPDAAATVQAQFATWAAKRVAGAQTGDALGGTDRHILVGVSQPTDDPSQHRAFALRARYDIAAGGWVAELGEQNRNDQMDGWEPAAGAASARVYPTAAACLGAAVTRLIELVDRDAAGAASSR